MVDHPAPEDWQRDLQRILGPDGGELSYERAEELLRQVPCEDTADDSAVEAMVDRILARGVAEHGRHAVRIPWWVRGVAAALVIGIVGSVLLMQGSFVKQDWDGRDSTHTLSYEEAFAVFFDSDRTFKTRQAAQVRIHRYIQDTLDTLQTLESDPTVAAQVATVWQGLTALVDHATPMPTLMHPSGVLEQLTDRVTDTSLPARLRQEAVFSLGNSLAVGMALLESARDEGGLMRTYSDILLERLQKRLHQQ